MQIRLNFAIEDAGIFSQLAHLANLLEKLDPTLYFKLRQVCPPWPEPVQLRSLSFNVTFG
jgi:hypothetical protein